MKHTGDIALVDEIGGDGPVSVAGRAKLYPGESWWKTGLDYIAVSRGDKDFQRSLVLEQLLKQTEKLLPRVGPAFVEGVYNDEDGLVGRRDNVEQEFAQLDVGFGWAPSQDRARFLVPFGEALFDGIALLDERSKMLR
jgi:hypothetical protein